MPKAKRILRSVRFKYCSAIKRFSTWSNCVWLAIFLFVAAVVFSISDYELNEESDVAKLDEFKAANSMKMVYHSTTKFSSTHNVKKYTNDDTKTTPRNDAPKSSKAVSRQQSQDRMLHVLKILALPSSSFKSAKKPDAKSNKISQFNVFEAMAHPRLFTQTAKSFEKSDPAAKPGARLNDWIQANNPRDKTKLLVYSAYWDDRFSEHNIVRIMAVMATKNPPSVYCRLQMDDDSFNDVPATRKIMNEHWRLKYSSYFLSCECSKKMETPSKVYVSLNRNFTFSAMLPVYRNKEDKTSPRGDLAVCVKPMHYHYNRATWMVEFIELHRIFGVEHFFFYNHSVGEDVDILLRHYMQQNIVTVLPWNLPVKSQKEIRTEGIFSSLNDCVFRTMYLFHYVVLLDFDEYIIPREHNNYLDMLEELEEDNKRIRGKPGSFVFRNVFFYLYWENDTTAYGAAPEKPPEQIPYLITQYKTRRLSTSMKTGSRSKYIVVPDAVLEVGNHVVWRHLSGNRAIQVPETVALLHHYRICEFGGFSCLKKPNLVDRTANKFGGELLRRVFEECHKIYPELEGKCPVSPPLGSPW